MSNKCTHRCMNGRNCGGCGCEGCGYNQPKAGHASLWAIVLEKPDDFGESPDLILALSRDAAIRQLVHVLGVYEENLTEGLELPEWLAENPVPDATSADLSDLHKWLEELHGNLSEYWWSEFEVTTDMATFISASALS